MFELTPFLLRLPDISAAAWLAQYDAVPSLLPRWPKSRRMTLVGVSAPMEPADALSRAYVITDPRQVEPAVASDRLVWLFFRVPRSVVLEADVVPDGLTATSWTEEFVEEKKSA